MSPDGATPAGDGPHDPWLAARVTRLEDDMGEIKAALRRLEPLIIRTDARMEHMATKADLEAVRSELKGEIAGLRTELKGEIAGLRTELKGEIAGLRTELKEEIAGLRGELKGEIAEVRIALADKPSRTYMWGIMTAMIAAFACGLAGLAVLK